ncbi:capsule biosynthesis GfcC family protein [Stenotrophomonas sp. MMGLT7]|uniref:capsule biosynthesis GfcC family protein n=1 Tax=Stenotrophomonas sp. MMGLT7 TaxID=2901227 RepID=UPI001E3EA283|nr:capsule biosynthesis GfcC family protein [Stenotrophomonas sp. MMGLT7]MCD7100379.1 capsule biosynthesis GfcC family protein [Stenotrophomonas sp. MMGLT7]
MSFLRLAALLALQSAVAFPAAAQPAAAPVTVTVEGAVHAPGQYPVPAGHRLSEAVLAARPDATAYPLGAALLRQAAYTEQVRLKAGLLYDLQQLQAQPDSELAATAATQAQWLQTLPVTGRVPQLLEPRQLEIQTADNPLAAAGDRVVYPLRPDHVRIVGAVARSCQVPHVPLQAARAYLAACPATTVADRDVAYVVQPDGQVQQIGIAAWNRSAPQPLAPGAIVYVPLAQHALRKTAPDFNAEFARFLATQLLPAPGVSP